MKTIRRLIATWFALIASLVSFPSLAEEVVSPPDATAGTERRQAAPIRPALWKVADKDTTIYLFGTIHVLPEGVDWFGGKVADAFTQSGSLVTEIAEDDPEKMQGLVTSLAMLPPEKSLRAQLPAEQLAQYDAALAQYGLPAAMLDRFEPWYAAVALSTVPLLQQGYDASHGVEETLDVKAKQRGLPHQGLETPEYQLGLFDGLPEDVQTRYLSEVIAQLPTFKKDIESMFEAWKQGDAETLARLMNADESDPVLVKTLLTDRNRAWAQWIDTRMDTPGTVFVAVGAGHLAGPGSVQDQLAAMGITSTRLQ